MMFGVTFLFSIALAAMLVIPVRRIASRARIVDEPSSAPRRKVHSVSTPLLGGLAVWCAFFGVLVLALAFGIDFMESGIKQKHLIGLFLGSSVLMIGGFLDDRFHLTPRRQFIAPLLAALIVIISGVGITHVANPLGGPLGNEQIFLDTHEYILFWFNGWPYKVTLFADVFTLVWMMGMMYTTKFLDGLDGLVSSITIIGAVMIAALALNPAVAQNETALLALILTGAFAGFLFWNWNPARIFLGEGGSLFAGFMLGALAIIADSKVATTVLVFSIPILDVAWVIVRRIMIDRRSPFVGDRTHLHFRLLDAGLSHRQAVLLLAGLATYFGFGALFLQSRGALALFFAISLLLFGLLWVLWRRRLQRPLQN